MSLAEVWNAITPLLEDKVSLIPVRDKDVTDNSGNTYPAKTPYSGWKKYQYEQISADQLWKDMERRNTTAVALIAGTISGSMEIIDIDVKYNPGIDAILFKDMQQLYPDLFDKLRIHKTPSGGFHILYRIQDGEVPGNIKLAGRYPTPEELESKPKTKTYNFIETRGEGGYALVPPALGYSVYKANGIPVITWAERCSLITLCKTYTTIIPVKQAPKVDKRTDEIYSSNPWEDYDNRIDPYELLEGLGWSYHSETTAYIQFTRPGKDNGVSGGWHKENRIFFVFTSSTELEPDTGYRPATLLALLQFEGNYKETYKHLKEYYGVYADFYEDKVVKRTAINGGELPKNFSERAKAKFEDIKQHLSENLPYGYFWQMHPTRIGEYKINREHLYRTAELMGFRRKKGSEHLYKIEGKIIVTHTPETLYTTLKNYIWDENEYTRNLIWNALDAFQQSTAEFSVKQMPDIMDELILADEAHLAYKYFTNGVLKITANEQSFYTYDEVEGLIWADKIKPREYQLDAKQSTLYADFIQNAIGDAGYVKRVLGYLAHDFRSESSGYVVVLLEKNINPKDGGGTGKNILGNMFAGTSSVRTVPGSSIKFDDKFLAAWHGERIYFLADIPKKIDWLFLKEMATGTGYVNKKYIAEYSVSPGDMPKILVNTNYSFEDEDGGVKRRIKTVEFTNFYSVRGGVDVVHGKMFPDDFDEQDWAGYDHFMVECLTELFKAKGKLEHNELSYDGWIKKFNMSHGESTFMFIEDNIKEWLEMEFVPLATFNHAYTNFCNDNGIKYVKGDLKLTAAIHDYCSKHGILFINSDRGRNEENKQVRGKKFKIEEI